MFSFRDFIRKGFLNAVGRLADYQIILNAAGWYDKGVLLEADLAEIQSAIDAQAPDAAPTAETPSENGESSSGDNSPVEENDGNPAEETPV